MEIQYIGPLKCKKCGREVPEDRACPRCESGPWWPVVLAFFVCGFAIGGIVYMVAHPRVKAVPRTVGETVIDSVDYQQRPFVKFQIGANT